MAEYTAIADQTVLNGQPMIFTETTVPCNRGLIRHEDGTGLFSLSGAVPASEYQNRCCCQGEPTADYLVVFTQTLHFLKVEQLEKSRWHLLLTEQFFLLQG